MIDLEAIRLEKTNSIYPEDLTLRDLRDMRVLIEDRLDIAIFVWRVCAEFLCDFEPLVAGPGQSMVEAAEEYVREHADEVESRTITWPNPYNGTRNDYQAIVMLVLDEFALAEDYMRIKANEQHMAFED